MKAPFQNDRKTIVENPKNLEEWVKTEQQKPEKITEKCPYCESKNIVKRGRRRKKLEEVQLYICNSCNKTFTPQKQFLMQPTQKISHLPPFPLQNPVAILHPKPC